MKEIPSSEAQTAWGKLEKEWRKARRIRLAALQSEVLDLNKLGQALDLVKLAQGIQVACCTVGVLRKLSGVVRPFWSRPKDQR